MNTYQQALNSIKDYEKQVRAADKPFGIFINSVNPETEKAVLQFFGEKAVNVLHPYVGLDSWFRVMPTRGAGGVAAIRADTEQPELFSYWNPNPEVRVQSFLKRAADPDVGGELYRPLQGGEFEASSLGIAQTYWSRRGQLEERGGLVRNWLDRDELEAGIKAATHKRVLHQNKVSEIGDEERLGCVKRPKMEFGKKSNIFQEFVKYNGSFAKEWLQILINNGQTPTKLFDKREGDVIDDDGKPYTSDITGNALRLRHRLYTKDNLEIVWDVDNIGNYVIKLPNSARSGWTWDIADGNWKIFVGRMIDWTCSQSFVSNFTKDWRHTIGGQVTFDITKDCSYTIKEGNLTFTTSQGDMLLNSRAALSATAAKDITVTSETENITLEAKRKNINLTADIQDINLTAYRDINVKARNKVIIEAESNIMNIKSVSTTVESTGDTHIDGARVIVRNGTGRVLTHLTDPVVDTITGVPSTGLANFLAQ